MKSGSLGLWPPAPHLPRVPAGWLGECEGGVVAGLTPRPWPAHDTFCCFSADGIKKYHLVSFGIIGAGRGRHRPMLKRLVGSECSFGPRGIREQPVNYGRVLVKSSECDCGIGGGGRCWRSPGSTENSGQPILSTLTISYSPIRHPE